MVVIFAMTFVRIAFDDTTIRMPFLLAFLVSLINDFIRRKFVKKKFLYIISFLLSIVVAGTMKYFFFSLMDGYLYILLIEVLFRDKTKLSIYLLPLHFLSFFASDFLMIPFHSNFQSFTASLGNDLLYYLLGLCIMLSVREVLIQKDQMQLLNTDLNNKNQLLEKYQDKLKELALIAERNRVAQELHDSLGHTLMAIRMNVKVLEKLNQNNTDKEQQILQSLDDIVQDGIIQLRETVFELKNDSETNKTLKSSLQEMIEHISINGEAMIYLDFNDLAENSLPEIKDAIYKAVKECITNAIRHGKAREIKINLSEDNEYIYLTIADNGSGCSKVKESFGLKGIAERFSALDGHTSYQSELNHGFVFQAYVPLVKRESGNQSEGYTGRL
jgi:Signal transduction histidine kinase